ncbi:MAG: CHAT domain-containing protein [Pyrinomonadaceae bacterium]
MNRHRNRYSFLNSLAPVAFVCLVASVFIAPPSRAVGELATPASSTTSKTGTTTSLMPAAQQNEAAIAALRQGVSLLRRSNADQALAPLETALRLFTAANDARGQAAAHDALGELYERQGQYNVALDHYRSARQAFNTTSDSFHANLMFAKIGDMRYRQGDTAEARTAYSEMDAPKPNTNALNTFNAVRAKPNKVRGLLGRARSIATGTPSTSTGSQAASVATDAASEIKQGFELYRQFVLYATQELGLGRVDFLTSKLDSAKQHFTNALGAAGGDVPVIGKLGQTRRVRIAARTSLADIAFQQGRFEDAAALYTDAASGAESDGRFDLAWPAQRGIGRSRLALATRERDASKAAKLRGEALDAYRKAIKTIETIRQGSLRADESRTTFLASTKDVYDEASGALADMALENRASNSAPLSGTALQNAGEAFKIVEAGRARSLLDLLAESRAEITEGVPTELLERKQDNLERQQEIARQLTGVSVTDDAPAQPVQELEAELERLSVDYDSIENNIRVASPRYAALTEGQPLSLSEAQAKVLDDKTALLEYSLGNERSYLWVVTQKDIALYKLPAREQLDKQAIELRAQIIPAELRRSIVGINVTANQSKQAANEDTDTNLSQDAATYAAAANALYKTVLEPAASVFADKRLLVVADGALNYVPFEALVTKSGGNNYAELSYLVKTNEVIYAPSVSVVAAVRQQGGRSRSGGVLLVADPVFDSSDTRAPRSTAANSQSGNQSASALTSALADVAGVADKASTDGLKLARLNGSRAEAQQISQLTRAAGGQANTWLDLEANESNVKTRGANQYRIVHIATHGLLDAERPQFTGLVLSLVGNSTGDDGFLRTDEIFNLRLGSPLVMLSACETGLGKEKRGEGVIGLTRAFMYAGAPTVGVSLWSVADRSTALLMTDFYKRLLANAAPSAAMRAAQQQMIAGKRYSAPFFWAPFVLNGDWR